jgi:hypothetical protein
MHTKGPWSVYGYEIVANYRSIAQVPNPNDFNLTPSQLEAVEKTSMANAKLIAAAPMLLEALRRISTLEYQRLQFDYCKQIAKAAIQQAGEE